MKKTFFITAVALLSLIGAAGCCRTVRLTPENVASYNFNKEIIVQNITHEGVVFEIVWRPETVYAGKAYYENELLFNEEVREEIQKALDSVLNPRPSAGRIKLAMGFGENNPERSAHFFAKETETKDQPEGVDVFVMPGSLFIRGYDANIGTGRLFTLLRHVIPPKFGYKIAENGAQVMDYYDDAELTGFSRGYLYMPVMRVEQQGAKK